MIDDKDDIATITTILDRENLGQYTTETDDHIGSKHYIVLIEPTEEITGFKMEWHRAMLLTAISMTAPTH